MCASKVLARRCLEIGTAVASAQAQGLDVGIVTLTMRHDRKQGLAQLWDALAKAWSRATSGKAWKGARARYGIVGYLRVVEVTWGRNGWHVHVHALLFGHLDASKLDAVAGSMWGRWSAGLQGVGLAAPLLKGSEWHIVGGDLYGTAIGQYLSKGMDAAGSIGMELTQTQSKVAVGVHKTRPVWELLDGAIEGEALPLRLWWEWERESKGRRQIAWSQGLRERLGIGMREQTDQEICDEEIGTAEDTLVWITRQGWDAVIRRCMAGDGAFQAEILDQAERLDVEEFSAWLSRQGIEHRRA